MMHLYTYDPAPNPRRLTLFLSYKGIELPTTQIDMRENEHRGADFLAINPLGTLPALLTDDGVLLTEVIAICDYLESQHPAKPLMGSTPLERALVLSWDHRIFVSIFEAFAEMLRNRSPAFENRALPGPLDVEQIPALEERGRKRFRGSLELFDKELGDKPFLCGDTVSFADIDLLVGVETARWVKESIPEGCSRLEAWLERTREALA
ncbi:glutathione S-transferase family protein [Congregibacter litoralis]|uniref:Glutathione S-transferase n=1 Tax=Congregibacter litoralis KT71 TaxID=314285 RepID=A4ABJ8_9GAMM|nr:glutathione S-transferase family protein [Congregibacter litoralis]EAQ96752.1 Glutathione S-transferase [Congregibacter litoralis KT71]